MCSSDLIKCQRFSTFTLLLISKSYWFDKPRFVNGGKLLLTTSSLRLGHNRTLSSTPTSSFSGAVARDRTKATQEDLSPPTLPVLANIHNRAAFLAPLPGTFELQQGESHTLNHFTLFLSCLLYFSFSLFFLLQNFKTQKKLV